MTTSDAVYHAKYYKEKDSEGIRLAPHIHDGDGTIKVRGFFTDVSQLPMRVQVWELEPGMSGGFSYTRGRGGAGGDLLLPGRIGHRVGGR